MSLCELELIASMLNTKSSLCYKSFFKKPTFLGNPVIFLKVNDSMGLKYSQAFPVGLSYC